MGIRSETRANPIENSKQLNNTLKNSSQKLHLLYLPTLGRISKPDLKTRQKGLHNNAKYFPMLLML